MLFRSSTSSILVTAIILEGLTGAIIRLENGDVVETRSASSTLAPSAMENKPVRARGIGANDCDPLRGWDSISLFSAYNKIPDSGILY